MPAKTPEEICSLFRKYMSEGNIESLLDMYDAEAVFLNQSGEAKKGRAEIRQELLPWSSAKTIFDFKIRQVVRSVGIALMHTEWTVSSPRPMRVDAIEVARRQPDGTWRWLIGDPFTVGKYTAREKDVL